MALFIIVGTKESECHIEQGGQGRGRVYTEITIIFIYFKLK